MAYAHRGYIRTLSRRYGIKLQNCLRIGLDSEQLIQRVECERKWNKYDLFGQTTRLHTRSFD